MCSVQRKKPGHCAVREEAVISIPHTALLGADLSDMKYVEDGRSHYDGTWMPSLFDGCGRCHV